MKTLLALLLFPWSLLGAVYYVDVGSGSDSNAGTSTGAAWAHLPDTQGVTGSGWVTIQNGDTIYVKGGTTNTIQLYIPPTSSHYNGSAAYNSIHIISGEQNGWGTGRAIYDMQTNYTSGFWIQSANGVTVDGFEIRNIKAGGVGAGFDTSTGSAGVDIGSGSSYITVRRCYIHDCFRKATEPSDDTGHGIETQQPSHHLIFECNNIGPRIGTKGIEPVQGSSFVIIRSNLIVNCKDHNLAISANRCDVYNNLVIAQGPYAHDPIYPIKNTGASNDFWNNVVYENPTSILSASGIGLSEPADANGGHYNRVINNTVYHMQSPGNFAAAGVGMCIGISAQVISNCIVANNLFLNSTNFQGPIQLFYQNNSVNVNLIKNCLFGGAGVTSVANYGGQSGPPAVSVASLESSINGGNGTASGNVNADPKLTGGTLPTSLDATSFLPNTSYFALSALSPSSLTNTGNAYLGASDRGYSSASGKFGTDILGNTRVIWSMGAYEFGGTSGGGGGGVTGPGNLRVTQQSVGVIVTQ